MNRKKNHFMLERKINKKIIRKEAKTLLNQGITKQETFELLVDKYKFSHEIASVLNNIPSAKAIAKYGIWNNILLALLILTSIIYFINSAFMPIIYNGFLAYGVISKRVNFYIWITILSSMGLIVLVAIILTDSSITIDWKVMILLGIYLTSTILPIWLEKKLCPKTTERKEIYTNSEGQQKSKIIYDFSDV